MGEEAYSIFKSNRKKENNETLTELKTLMAGLLVVKKSEYTEICAFRRAFNHKEESVNDYAMRLRKLSEHCRFGENTDKEIERQFVVSCGMLEEEKECVRSDDLNLAKVFF